MPEQQPDKRCGTCEHYCPRREEGWCYANAGNVSEYSGTKCSAWTPKPPKNPEEK